VGLQYIHHTFSKENVPLVWCNRADKS